jgi:hypothetical protein
MTYAILDHVTDAILSVFRNKDQYHRLAIVAKTGEYYITTV